MKFKVNEWSIKLHQLHEQEGGKLVLAGSKATSHNPPGRIPAKGSERCIISPPVLL
jgi:hypothetical protein